LFLFCCLLPIIIRVDLDLRKMRRRNLESTPLTK
jgi:hypothetical protein